MSFLSIRFPSSNLMYPLTGFTARLATSIVNFCTVACRAFLCKNKLLKLKDFFKRIIILTHYLGCELDSIYWWSVPILRENSNHQNFAGALFDPTRDPSNCTRWLTKLRKLNLHLSLKKKILELEEPGLYGLPLCCITSSQAVLVCMPVSVNMYYLIFLVSQDTH